MSLSENGTNAQKPSGSVYQTLGQTHMYARFTYSIGWMPGAVFHYRQTIVIFVMGQHVPSESRILEFRQLQPVSKVRRKPKMCASTGLDPYPVVMTNSLRTGSHGPLSSMINMMIYRLKLICHSCVKLPGGRR